MHIAEVVTIAKSLPLLRLNTYKSLILSYSADYRRIFTKNGLGCLLRRMFLERQTSAPAVQLMLFISLIRIVPNQKVISYLM